MKKIISMILLITLSCAKETSVQITENSQILNKIEYYKNHSVKSDKKYDKNKKNGKFHYYTQDGKLKKTINYSDNKTNAIIEYDILNFPEAIKTINYYSNGEINSIYFKNMEELDGKKIVFYENGNKKQEEDWIIGLPLKIKYFDENKNFISGYYFTYTSKLNSQDCASFENQSAYKIDQEKTLDEIRVDEFITDTSLPLNKIKINDFGFYKNAEFYIGKDERASNDENYYYPEEASHCTTEDSIVNSKENNIEKNILKIKKDWTYANEMLEKLIEEK